MIILSKWIYSTYNRTVVDINSILKISYPYFNCMTFDNNNVLWAGTNEDGIINFDGSVWKKYNSTMYLQKIEFAK